MYHEEKIIDGVLHWRGLPNGAWRPVSPAALTERLMAAEARARDAGRMDWLAEGDNFARVAEAAASFRARCSGPVPLRDAIDRAMGG